MPRALPDEVLEEVLRRLQPHEPAMLVRAALVSRRWCRLLSDAGFRRRFREFHRRPPILGMLCNDYTHDPDFPSCSARFAPTTTFCTPRKNFSGMSVLDARHGRVLFSWYDEALVVWDPIADKQVRKLRLPWKNKEVSWTAAVLCSTAGGGACDHLDCRQGHFRIVFVSNDESGNAVVCTYSSDAAAWSECVCSQHKYSANAWPPPSIALVGNSLYFGNGVVGTALRFDLELRQVSLVVLPSLRRIVLRESVLTTVEGDDRLWLVNEDDSKLYMWSRKDTPEVDAKWESRVIELKTVFPADVDVSRLGVIGSDVGIIFMREREVYTFDLKTYEVKKVHGGIAADTVIPYMSFYTPALEEVRNQVQVAQVHDEPKVLVSKVLRQGKTRKY